MLREANKNAKVARSSKGRSQATTSQARSGWARKAESIAPKGPSPMNESGIVGQTALSSSACSGRQERNTSWQIGRNRSTKYSRCGLPCQAIAPLSRPILRLCPPANTRPLSNGATAAISCSKKARTPAKSEIFRCGMESISGRAAPKKSKAGTDGSVNNISRTFVNWPKRRFRESAFAGSMITTCAEA